MSRWFLKLLTLRTSKRVPHWNIVSNSPIPQRPDSDFKVPVIEERLIVDKRVEDAGGVRLRKTVHEEPQTVQEDLYAEEVRVERRAVGTLVTGTDRPAAHQEGEVWVIPVLAEVLVTEKRLMLVEEIRVTRVASSRSHVETVVLRREEVSVERLEPGESDGART